MAVNAARQYPLNVECKGPDGKRHFSLEWYLANFNDSEVLCSDKLGGPLADLAAMIRKGGRCHLTRVSIWVDGTTAGFLASYHYLTLFLAKVNATPLWYGEPRYMSALADVAVWDMDLPVDPLAGGSTLRIYNANYSATDDMWIVLEGWFDG